MKIKVIAFDQGGIYIGVDYDATIKAFEKLGATNAGALYTQANQSDVIDQFERGKVAPALFYQYLRETLKNLRTDVSDQQLYDAWNAMLTGVIPGVLEYIKELRGQGYITVVVSNADIIHHRGVEQQLDEAGARQLFDVESFDARYISYQIGHNKPYADIFREVTKQLQQQFPQKNIQPKNILFIDDSEKHLSGRKGREDEGAAIVGWQTMHVSSNLPVDQFKKKLMERLKVLGEQKE